MKLLKNQKVIFGLLAISLLIGLFYWYEYRPSQIRNECHRIAQEKAVEIYAEKAYENPYDYNKQDLASKGYFNSNTYDRGFEICLNSKGL